MSSNHEPLVSTYSMGMPVSAAAVSTPARENGSTSGSPPPTCMAVAPRDRALAKSSVAVAWSMYSGARDGPPR